MRQILFATVVTSGLLLVPLQAQDAEVQLQRAVQRETTSGDVRAAIADYRRIADDAGTSRPVKAKALLRLADAHRKLGEMEARRIYERIIADYADQHEVVAEARSTLGRLSIPTGSAGRAARQIWVGADSMGTLSADGRFLSFTDWETGDLAVRDLARSTSQRLTNTGGWEASGDYAEFSVISPDGKQVAYAWFSERRSPRSAYDLRVVSTAATASAAPRILHRDDESAWLQPIAWRADGREIIFLRQLQDRTHEIAIAPVSGGPAKSIKRFGRFGPTKVSLAPDGKTLAYDLPPDESRPAKRDIYLMPLDGGPSVPLVRHSGDDHGPTWSPDGSMVLFSSERTGARALWAQFVDQNSPRGEPVLVTADIQSPVLGLSASGALFHVRGGNTRNVYSVPMDSRMRVADRPTLITDRFLNSNRSAVWSPDGRRIAFYTTRGANNSAPGSVSLLVLHPESGGERNYELQIMVAAGASAGLQWFPDGRSLLVAGRELDAGATGFHRLELETGRLERLHTTRFGGTVTTHPAVTPDGASIIFVDGLTGTSERSIARLDLRTGEVTELRTGVWFASVAMAPDGQSLAFVEQSREIAGTSRLAVMPITGGSARTVFEAPWSDPSRVGSVTWTRDGTRLLFVRSAGDGEQRLWSVPATGGAPADTGISVKGQLKIPNFHPDGKQLAYTAVRSEPAELWVLEGFLPARPTK